MTQLNNYGDNQRNTVNGHGNDISSQRIDELDQQTLDEIARKLATNKHIKALDIGCGMGGQSLRMAKTGAWVTSVDSEDYHEVFDRMTGINKPDFTQLDAMDIKDIGDAFDIITCQRMIHYLGYYDAQYLLTNLSGPMSMSGAKLFLSASGLKSELGDGYQGSDKIEDRYAPLAKEMADKHHIHHPVCLYTEDELRQLVESSGWVVDKVYSSPFGNVKLIARKPE